jgi:hypothetical protein
LCRCLDATWSFIRGDEECACCNRIISTSHRYAARERLLKVIDSHSRLGASRPACMVWPGTGLCIARYGSVLALLLPKGGRSQVRTCLLPRQSPDTMRCRPRDARIWQELAACYIKIEKRVYCPSIVLSNSELGTLRLRTA